jgi:hypothetical protein
VFPSFAAQTTTAFRAYAAAFAIEATPHPALIPQSAKTNRHRRCSRGAGAGGRVVDGDERAEEAEVSLCLLGRDARDREVEVAADDLGDVAEGTPLVADCRLSPDPGGWPKESQELAGTLSGFDGGC